MNIKNKRSLKKIYTTALLCSLAVLPSIAHSDLFGLFSPTNLVQCLAKAGEAKTQVAAQHMIAACNEQFKSNTDAPITKPKEQKLQCEQAGEKVVSFGNPNAKNVYIMVDDNIAHLKLMKKIDQLKIYTSSPYSSNKLNIDIQNWNDFSINMLFLGLIKSSKKICKKENYIEQIYCDGFANPSLSGSFSCDAPSTKDYKTCIIGLSTSMDNYPKVYSAAFDDKCTW